MPYGPEGPLDCKIAFVAEAPAREEMRLGAPLVGPSGRLFDTLLHSNGISRKECYLTNVCDHMIPDTGVYLLRNGLSARGQEQAQRLKEELSHCTANVIVCMGALSLMALTGKTGILKQRGSILESTLLPGRKVIPTIHPAGVLRGQYIWKYLIAYDMKRARKESAFPEIRYPPYRFYLDPTPEEALSFLEEIKKQKKVAFDLEADKNSIRWISFAWSDTDAVSISPSKMTLDQEVEFWCLVSEILGDPKITKIAQNITFDASYLWQKMNILVRPPYEDTMIAHHIMYPDFPKGLAFLCSLYTDQPYYKDMVRHDDVEKSDG